MFVETKPWLGLLVRINHTMYRNKGVDLTKGEVLSHFYVTFQNKFLSGEGDAFGNLHLTPNGGAHKSAVMLRCSCCVDIHILNVNDLKEVLQIFPEFSKNLKKKTSTIMKKTVLTSQVRSGKTAKYSLSGVQTQMETSLQNAVIFFPPT